MDRLIDKLGSYEKIKELSNKELFDLADEIRDFLKESICRTGGHLGVNTGVVELTLALHFVFDSLHDKFIWDVGHNVYVHKILTGRADLLDQAGNVPGVGFATDFLGFLLIFPITRKLFFGNLSNRFKKQKSKKNNFIEGEYEDVDDNDDRKI